MQLANNPLFAEGIFVERQFAALGCPVFSVPPAAKRRLVRRRRFVRLTWIGAQESVDE
jgi:hypothetical protein